jgi:hypothetical protein
VIRFNKEPLSMTQNVIAAQQLFLTADKQALVGEGDARAAFLYAAQGDEIPPEMAEKFGLVGGALPRPAAGNKAERAEKAAPAPATKPKRTPANKAAAPAETKDA